MKARELVGIDLHHAAPRCRSLTTWKPRRLGWKPARRAGQSGGAKTSRRAESVQQYLTERHPRRDPRTPYLCRYARFGVAGSPSVVEDGWCGGGFGGPRRWTPGLVGTRGPASSQPKDHPDPPLSGCLRPLSVQPPTMLASPPWHQAGGAGESGGLPTTSSRPGGRCRGMVLKIAGKSTRPK